MNTHDVLNLSLALGFIVITICIVFITYYLVKTLKSISSTAQNISDTTETIRENMQLKALSSLPALIFGLIRKIVHRKGGEKNGR